MYRMSINVNISWYPQKYWPFLGRAKGEGRHQEYSWPLAEGEWRPQWILVSFWPVPQYDQWRPMVGVVQIGRLEKAQKPKKRSNFEPQFSWLCKSADWMVRVLLGSQVWAVSVIFENGLWAAHLLCRDGDGAWPTKDDLLRRKIHGLQQHRNWTTKLRFCHVNLGHIARIDTLQRLSGLSRQVHGRAVYIPSPDRKVNPDWFHVYTFPSIWGWL